MSTHLQLRVGWDSGHTSSLQPCQVPPSERRSQVTATRRPNQKVMRAIWQNMRRDPTSGGVVYSAFIELIMKIVSAQSLHEAFSKAKEVWSAATSTDLISKGTTFNTIGFQHFSECIVGLTRNEPSLRGMKESASLKQVLTLVKADINSGMAEFLERTLGHSQNTRQRTTPASNRPKKNRDLSYHVPNVMAFRTDEVYKTFTRPLTAIERIEMASQTSGGDENNKDLPFALPYNEQSSQQRLKVAVGRECSLDASFPTRKSKGIEQRIGHSSQNRWFHQSYRGNDETSDSDTDDDLDECDRILLSSPYRLDREAVATSLLSPRTKRRMERQNRDRESRRKTVQEIHDEIESDGEEVAASSILLQARELLGKKRTFGPPIGPKQISRSPSGWPIGLYLPAKMEEKGCRTEDKFQHPESDSDSSLTDSIDITVSSSKSEDMLSNGNRGIPESLDNNEESHAVEEETLGENELENGNRTLEELPSQENNIQAARNSAQGNRETGVIEAAIDTLNQMRITQSGRSYWDSREDGRESQTNREHFRHVDTSQTTQFSKQREDLTRRYLRSKHRGRKPLEKMAHDPSEFYPKKIVLDSLRKHLHETDPVLVNTQPKKTRRFENVNHFALEDVIFGQMSQGLKLQKSSLVSRHRCALDHVVNGDVPSEVLFRHIRCPELSPKALAAIPKSCQTTKVTTACSETIPDGDDVVDAKGEIEVEPLSYMDFIRSRPLPSVFLPSEG